MTRTIEVSVPVPSVVPREAITELEVICPIRNPATVRMLPEVIIVAKH